MKNPSLIICLTISALFGSVGGVVASDLPDCPSSGYFDNCFGTITFADDDKYVGEWKDNKYNGQGTYTFGPNSEWAGDKYVGEFKDDKYNGQGTYTYANGDKYVGEYKDDKRNGQGTYTFADGTKEVGEFKDGKLNGYAVQYSSDGSILKEGIWKDDEFQYAQNNPSSNSDETSSSPCLLVQVIQVFVGTTVLAPTPWKMVLNTSVSSRMTNTTDKAPTRLKVATNTLVSTEW